MKVLLDTHVLVWAESLDDRLGDAARALLMDAATTLLVSPITSLELGRLVSLSRLTLRYSLKDWLAQARQNLQLKDAPLSHGIGMASYMLPGDFHKDPADRILVATARELGCPLLTADDLILRYPHVQTLDARS